jgi:hypothetical protein
MYTYNVDFAQGCLCMYAYKDVSVPRGRVVHGAWAVVGGGDSFIRRWSGAAMVDGRARLQQKEKAASKAGWSIC